MSGILNIHSPFKEKNSVVFHLEWEIFVDVLTSIMSHIFIELV